MTVLAATLAAAALSLAAAPPSADGALDEHLAAMQVELTDRQPYRFVLRYRGPNTPFRGMVCYHFAGYNETCLDPGIDWLTPATRIELYAPGGVPRDLLEGYMLLVRFPALSERTFRYPPTRPSAE
ncbi:MAG TPA: hypothetical protein VF210_16595 [Pseudomonadales bacterium]